MFCDLWPSAACSLSSPIVSFGPGLVLWYIFPDVDGVWIRCLSVLSCLVHWLSSHPDSGMSVEFTGQSETGY